ncbi:flagellar biosynthesis protein FlhB [Alicyclobacillus macrosporangiidus]|uniref:Flagellar biosynthetic protein FlhB n=1 Tax=Alicyclobacillus macrosporangiidus TaxID=392015 RepID=A0A1I7IQY5_9BACL|nr:flagellar biosynthesis protein FlhB [Alicyclobacillus macrosporangiidus]SFU75355.1 flagellar biosynthetic protein FlhB [Alicyclobacillus macrosporangiidus]
MVPFTLQRFAEERTERATPRRRAEVRRQGRVPHSPELSGAIALLAGVLSLFAFGSQIWNEAVSTMASGLAQNPPADWTPTGIRALFAHALGHVVRMVLPVSGIALAAGLATAFAQVGALFVPKLLLPDLRRIDPLAGLRRLWSARTLVEAAKSVLKLALVGGIAYMGANDAAGVVARLGGVDPARLPGAVGQLALRLAVEIAAAFAALALLDWTWQRFEFERSIRMTRQEVREEFRQQEGDPQIRQRIRQRARALAMRRMMQNVPKADVVVTNPTHYAVALRYDPATMTAPRVVAKGQDDLARRIRSLARTHGVPVVENRPLAQTLYRTVEVDEVIPRELYQAVAEVLAYVYRLRDRANEGVKR